MDSIKQAVAFLFRRAAEREMSEEQLARAASLDLHWFSPKDARRFVEVARAQGMLKAGAKAGTLSPAFDPAAVELPLDFRIDVAALSRAPAGAPADAGPVGEMLEKAAALRGVPVDQLWAEARAKAESKLLQVPVAAALVARESGVDVTPYLGRLADDLRRGASVSPSSS